MQKLRPLLSLLEASKLFPAVLFVLYSHTHTHTLPQESQVWVFLLRSMQSVLLALPGFKSSSNVQLNATDAHFLCVQSGKKTVKAVLWVSADGLRVVDDKTKVSSDFVFSFSCVFWVFLFSAVVTSRFASWRLLNKRSFRIILNDRQCVTKES